jgi:hypothetical protein
MVVLVLLLGSHHGMYVCQYLATVACHIHTHPLLFLCRLPLTACPGA